MDFFAYDQKGFQVCKDHLKPNEIEELANQILIVPFKLITKSFNLDLKYSVGFFWCEQNQKSEVFPVIGWTISKCTEKDKNNIQ